LYFPGEIKLEALTELNIKQEPHDGSHLESRETLFTKQTLHQLLAQYTVNGVVSPTIDSNLKQEKYLKSLKSPKF